MEARRGETTAEDSLAPLREFFVVWRERFNSQVDDVFQAGLLALGFLDEHDLEGISNGWERMIAPVHRVVATVLQTGNGRGGQASQMDTLAIARQVLVDLPTPSKRISPFGRVAIRAYLDWYRTEVPIALAQLDASRQQLLDRASFATRLTLLITFFENWYAKFVADVEPSLESALITTAMLEGHSEIYRQWWSDLTKPIHDVVLSIYVLEGCDSLNAEVQQLLELSVRALQSLEDPEEMSIHLPRRAVERFRSWEAQHVPLAVAEIESFLSVIG